MPASVAFRTDFAHSVVIDPDWLPLHFDQSGALTLCRVPAETRARLPFLRADFFGPETEQVALAPAVALSQLVGRPSVPLHFVFHTAFCGSTLLSNALGALPRCTAFKEPGILTQLTHQQGISDQPLDRTKLDLALRFLARPVGDATANVVKPSCFANPLIRPIMQARADSRTILLRGDLRAFLLSVAKRGLPGRNWGRQAFVSGLHHYSLPFPYAMIDLLNFTDLQVAGLAWAMRTRHFDQVSAELDRQCCLSIKDAELLGHPVDTLVKVVHFLEIDADSKDIAAIANSDILQRHSKEGRPYGLKERQRDLAIAREKFGREIDAVASWVEEIAPDVARSTQAASSSSSQ